jgi:hypothetical protein
MHSPYHRKKNCLCKRCYIPDSDLWCEAVTVIAILFLLYAAYVGVYDLGFRNCQKVGRFRSDFNLRMHSAVNEYHTCAFVDSTMVCLTQGPS